MLLLLRRRLLQQLYTCYGNEGAHCVANSSALDRRCLVLREPPEAKAKAKQQQPRGKRKGGGRLQHQKENANKHQLSQHRPGQKTALYVAGAAGILHSVTRACVRACICFLCVVFPPFFFLASPEQSANDMHNSLLWLWLRLPTRLAKPSCQLRTARRSAL